MTNKVCLKGRPDIINKYPPVPIAPAPLQYFRFFKFTSFQSQFQLFSTAVKRKGTTKTRIGKHGRKIVKMRVVACRSLTLQVEFYALCCTIHINASVCVCMSSINVVLRNHPEFQYS